jgi:PTS system mannose-specific IIB component/fructoselysine and glucoselysine-specific PTS system IIB component
VALLLARIDDRLIHGQVAHGWGRELRPTLIAIVSDALALDSGRADLYLFAVPEGARGRVVTVAEAASSAFQREIDEERTILIFPGTDEALRFREAGGALLALNLGGLHHAEGKTESLSYVFLDDADRARLRRLAALGVNVTARDLPSNPEHSLGELLDGGDE